MLSLIGHSAANVGTWIGPRVGTSKVALLTIMVLHQKEQKETTIKNKEENK